MTAMRRKIPISLACAVAAGLVSITSALAGSLSVNFDTDPAGILDIQGSNAEVLRWQEKGGNPATGGFLAVTYSQTYFNTHIVFDDQRTEAFAPLPAWRRQPPLRPSIRDLITLLRKEATDYVSDHQQERAA